MKKFLVYTLFFFVLLLAIIPAAFCEELVVYSARKEHLIRPLFDAYTQEMGIKVNYITGSAPVLLQRIKAEGKRTHADLLITVDAGNLWHAAQEEILQPVDSGILKRNIPVHLRDLDRLSTAPQESNHMSLVPMRI